MAAHILYFHMVYVCIQSIRATIFTRLIQYNGVFLSLLSLFNGFMGSFIKLVPFTQLLLEQIVESAATYGSGQRVALLFRETVGWTRKPAATKVFLLAGLTRLF